MSYFHRINGKACIFFYLPAPVTRALPLNKLISTCIDFVQFITDWLPSRRALNGMDDLSVPQPVLNYRRFRSSFRSSVHGSECEMGQICSENLLRKQHKPLHFHYDTASIGLTFSCGVVSTKDTDGYATVYRYIVVTELCHASFAQR